MVKEIKYVVFVKIPAKKAMTMPPITTTLGPSGIDISKFCDDFNEWSKDSEGIIETGVIVYDDLSYDIFTKEQYLEFKNSEFCSVFSASRFYNEFKTNEDKSFHR